MTAAMWPTATATDAKASGGARLGENVTLTDAAVRMWGTPVANDDNKTPAAHLEMKARMGGGRTEVTSLTVQSKMWATPRASMNENRTTKPAPSHGVSHGHTLAGQASGLRAETTTTDGRPGSPTADLNPSFVESLMGLPDGWSDPLASLTGFTCWETVWSRHVRRLHSAFSPEGC